MNGLKRTVMEIIEAGADEYKALFSAPYHIFNTTAFNQLNATKVEKVVYLIFKSGKTRLGLTAGCRDQMLLSPFSAPFGGFTPAESNVDLAYLDEAFQALESYLSPAGYRGIVLTLPPLFYHESFLSKCVNAAFRAGYYIRTADLNHAFHCSDFHEEYRQQILERNARKHLRTGLENGLSFGKASGITAEAEAYEVIALNRKVRGYPLRMTFGQVQATGEIVRVDYFLVKNETTPVASAIVFHVAPGIVQIIYWGDDPAYSALRPMNVLAYELFRYYCEAGLHIVDIGPSTEMGVPSYGLAGFKESLGCRVYLKFTLEKLISRL